MSDSKVRTKAFHSLKMRTTMLLTIVSFSLTIALVAISLNTYVTYSREEHIQIAEGVANLAAETIQADMIAEYIAHGKSVAGYAETENRLNSIWKNTHDIEYLYVYQIREDGCHTIFDTDEENADFEVDQFIEFDESFLPYLSDLLSGKEIRPLESNDKYGWLLTVYKPIFTRTGDCVAYVGVDISMHRLKKYERQFILQIAVSFAGIFFVILLVNPSFFPIFAQKIRKNDGRKVS